MHTTKAFQNGIIPFYSLIPSNFDSNWRQNRGWQTIWPDIWLNGSIGHSLPFHIADGQFAQLEAKMTVPGRIWPKIFDELENYSTHTVVLTRKRAETALRKKNKSTLVGSSTTVWRCCSVCPFVVQFSKIQIENTINPTGRSSLYQLAKMRIVKCFVE